MKIELHQLIFNLNNEDYHQKVKGYSSSQFKDLLDDESVFVAKHIDKTIERESIAAFDVGTYFHTGVLEPHKLKQDCVVFPGKIRRGKEWEKFKKKHVNKAIVTDGQKLQAEGIVQAVKDSAVAQKYLKGKPEVSLFTKIVVWRGRIFAPHYKMELTRRGWIKGKLPMSIEHGFEFTVKVRADLLGDTFMSDLKSTTGNARSTLETRFKIKDYEYDLSAALYMDMFSLKLPKITKFIWIFASKNLRNSKSYLASNDSILVGRAKYMKAMLKLAECAANDWQIEDTLGVIEPLPSEREYLVEKETDLL